MTSSESRARQVETRGDPSRSPSSCGSGCDFHGQPTVVTGSSIPLDAGNRRGPCKRGGGGRPVGSRMPPHRVALHGDPSGPCQGVASKSLIRRPLARPACRHGSTPIRASCAQDRSHHRRAVLVAGQPGHLSGFGARARPWVVPHQKIPARGWR